MKRAAVVILIMGGAFLAYRHFGSPGPAKRYREFAEEILKRNYAAAARMSDGLSEQQLATTGTQEHIGAGPAMFQTLFPSRYNIESEDQASDGTVTLHAIQTVLFNPPGVESALRPAMFAKLRQTVQLKKRDGEWKITSFENKFQEMDSLSSK
jgi:hypothetical protein